jgi:hypothetical protein
MGGHGGGGQAGGQAGGHGGGGGHMLVVVASRSVTVLSHGDGGMEERKGSPGLAMLHAPVLHSPTLHLQSPNRLT